MKYIYIIILTLFLVSCSDANYSPDSPSNKERVQMFVPPMVRGEGECTPENYKDGDKYRIITYASFGITKDEDGKTNVDKDGNPIIAGGLLNLNSCYRLSRTGWYAYDDNYITENRYKIPVLRAFDSENHGSASSPRYIASADLNDSTKCSNNGWISTAMPGLFYIYYVKPYDTPFEFTDGSAIYDENGKLNKPFEKLSPEELQKTRFIINPSDEKFNFYATSKVEPQVLGGYGVLDINKDEDNYLRPYRSKLTFRFYQNEKHEGEDVEIVNKKIRIYGAGVDNPSGDSAAFPNYKDGHTGYEMKVDFGKHIVEEYYRSDNKHFRTIDIKEKTDPAKPGLSYEGTMYVASGLYGSTKLKSKLLGGTPEELLGDDLNLGLSFDIQYPGKSNSVKLPITNITSEKFCYFKASHSYIFNVRLNGDLISIKLEKIEVDGKKVDWEDVNLGEQTIGE